MVGKTFRAFGPRRVLLLPPSLNDWLPEDHLARFVADLVDDVAFRFLAGGQEPDFRSFARFRRRHLDALAGLFTQSLHRATKLGMVKMERVALDGTKLEASVSRHKAMDYGRLVDKEERIEVEITQLEAQAQALLADAEAIDKAEDRTAEDRTFGADGKETDLLGERRSAL